MSYNDKIHKENCAWGKSRVVANNYRFAECFCLELAMNILKEEKLVDDMIMLELYKDSVIPNWDALFFVLEKHSIVLEPELQVDVKKIYDIIYSENISPGNYRMIKLHTPSRVRSLMGKWNPPINGQMKIGEVKEDIFKRVLENIQGERYYYNGKSKNEFSKGRYAYKLVVRGRIAVFVNLHRRISYHVIIEKT